MSYSHYYLATLLGLLIIGWGYTWFKQTATRSRQWLVKTTLCIIPIATIIAWWWNWPLDNLILLPPDWTRLQVIIGSSLSMALLSFWSRQLTNQLFSQAVNMRWVPYISTVVTLYLGQLLTANWGWSPTFFLTIVAACIALAALYKSQFTSVRLQAIALIITIAISISIGTVAAALAPTITGLTFGSWQIGWFADAILAIATVALAMPIVTGLWLNQPLKTSS